MKKMMLNHLNAKTQDYPPPTRQRENPLLNSHSRRETLESALAERHLSHLPELEYLTSGCAKRVKEEESCRNR